VNTLREAIQVWAEEEADIVIISREGRTVPAHRIILSLFSSKLKNLIKSSPLYIHSTIYLPESSYDSISNVLKSIYSGVTQDLCRSREFEETFRLLGFDKPISINQSSSSLIDIEDTSKVIDGMRGEPAKEFKRSKPNPAVKKKVTIGEEEDEEDAIVPPLPNGCLCRSFNPFLPTISCKNKSCSIKKFHLACVNLKVAPKGNWFCEACSTSLSVYKCEVCPYDTFQSKSLLLHYAHQHFKASLMELVDVFFKGNQCFHCDKEVYHNGDSQKIIHIGISHGKIKTILKNYGIDLQLKVPRTRQHSGTSKDSSEYSLGSLKCEMCNVQFRSSKDLLSHQAVFHSGPTKDSSGYSLGKLKCEICNIQFTSSNGLLSHQALFHFKSEITKLLKHFFLYQENNCKKCPHLNKGIPGISNKIIHVGTVHGILEKLMHEKNEEELIKGRQEEEKDPLIILNEVVVKEEIVEVLEIKDEI